MRLSVLRDWTRPARFARRLKRAAPGHRPVRLRLRLHESRWDVADIGREPSQVVLAVDRASFASLARRRYLLHALPVLVHVFSQTRVGSAARADISDGSPGSTCEIAFCADHDGLVLVPDPDFYNSHGYAADRLAPESQRPWGERKPEIVWRGASTGQVEPYSGPLDVDHPNAIQRVHLCRALQATPGVDAKLYDVVSPLNPDTDRDILERAGLLGGMVPTQEWRDRQFAIDIDGNTNAWSNLFRRLLYGCCVLKVASPNGFRQWYYDRLVPWSHYVPVAADLSDLHERIAWCRSHPEESRAIAEAGRAMALALTFDGEMRAAAERVGGLARED